eukprot:g2803.t1
MNASRFLRCLPSSSAILPGTCHVRRFFLRRTQLLCSVAVSSDESFTAEDQLKDEIPLYKAYLDFKFIQENVELLKENCWRRKAQANPETVAKLYTQYLTAKQNCEQLRAQRNENTKSMKGKLSKEQRDDLIKSGVELKNQISVAETELERIQNRLQIEGQRLPNLTHPDAPIGDEEDAVLVKTVGEKRKFDFSIKDHIELGSEFDLIDFETASVVTGSKFHYLKNEAALLEMALLNWTFQSVSNRGFTPIMTPDLIRSSVLEKCGFQPRAKNTQVYSVQDSDLALAGTAEVPLGGLYMDQIIDEDKLPIKLVAFGHCFRTEAGSPGTASKGLYRVHQFSKVEMFVICKPDQSEELLEELTAIEEELYTSLGLHFKILDMPTGDLGAPAYRKQDIEAWMPGLERYGEISSASNCTDYQSRRLNIRYRSMSAKTGKRASTEFVHTLNATACAVPRLLVCILENYQNSDNTISIPEILHPFMGGIKVISKDKKQG